MQNKCHQGQNNAEKHGCPKTAYCKTLYH
jgi:hypothetical protein